MILLILVVLFMFLLTALVAIWIVYPYKNQLTVQEKPVSIVVPFKEKNHQLEKLCSDLKALEFNESLEFILIDDSQTEEEWDVLDDRFNFIKNKGEGKKAAIAAGVERAKYDWVWQLDADVRIHPKSLFMLWQVVRDSTGIVLGPVSLLEGGKPYKTWIQQTEWILLQWVTALSTLFKKPFLANGANMLYRKDLYTGYQTSGFGSEYESGDDVFLLNYTNQKAKNRTVHYAQNELCVAYTEMAQSENQFVEQRKRWLGKMEHKGLRQGTFYKYLFLAIPFLMISSLLSVFLNLLSWQWGLGIIMMMLIWSSFLGYLLGMFWNQSKLMIWLVPFLFIYPFKLRRSLHS